MSRRAWSMRSGRVPHRSSRSYAWPVFRYARRRAARVMERALSMPSAFRERGKHRVARAAMRELARLGTHLISFGGVRAMPHVRWRGFFRVRRHPCRAIATTWMTPRADAGSCMCAARSLRIAPLGKGVMRSGVFARTSLCETARGAAAREAPAAMCATSRSTVKKHCEKHACLLRITKVFVYFTSLKTGGFASTLFRVCRSRKKPRTTGQKFAQICTTTTRLTGRPPRLNIVRPGGFFFETGNAMWADRCDGCQGQGPSERPGQETRTTRILRAAPPAQREKAEATRRCRSNG